MFMGPDAYVSPSWYPSKAEHGKTVPTWNYSLIYVRGMIETFDGAEELRAHVTALTERFERDAPAPWKVSDAPEDYLQRQFKGIVGLRLTIDTHRGQGQAQPEPHQGRSGRRDRGALRVRAARRPRHQRHDAATHRPPRLKPTSRCMAAKLPSWSAPTSRSQPDASAGFGVAGHPWLTARPRT